MKKEEHDKKEDRWKTNNQLEGRRLQIKERKLIWDQEQKIMFCDVSTLDESQRTYLLAMRAEIASAKEALAASSCVSEHGSASSA